MAKDAASKLWFTRHPDDDGFDELRLIHSESHLPILFLKTFYRWKTSGLSGDEWRTSVRWQRRGAVEWEDFDGPYRDLTVACAALYPGIYTSHPDMHTIPVGSIEFFRKGRVVYSMTYGEHSSKPMLVVCGHLPRALLTAREQAVPANTEPWDRGLCFQPGCQEFAVSTYLLKKRYCHEGHADEAVSLGHRHARRFCRKHLRRGDCGLEDADENYEVLEGPGPKDAQGYQQHESPSVFGGTIPLKE